MFPNTPETIELINAACKKKLQLPTKILEDSCSVILSEGFRPTIVEITLKLSEREFTVAAFISDITVEDTEENMARKVFIILRNELTLFLNMANRLKIGVK